jgi:fructoselysine 6-kinase
MWHPEGLTVMRLVALGDNCLDVYVEQDLVTVGGNALNVAVAWQLAGEQAEYRGAVGDDEAADVVREVLSGTGVDPTPVLRLPGPTGVTLIRLIDNDRQFIYEEFGVGASWMPDEGVVQTLAGARWVHVAGPLASTPAARTVGAAGHRVSIDVSTTWDGSPLTGVEVAFGSSPEANAVDAGRFAGRLVTAGAALGVVTCGEYGSLCHVAGQTFRVAAMEVDPVDTCGAGDSYIAGFITAHLHGLEPAACLEAGTRSATRTCRHLGSFPQPVRTIPDWLKQRYYPLAGLGGFSARTG